ncbi:methionyl-tRNA formyltransferase [Dermabacteraceae bacterium P13264]
MRIVFAGTPDIAVPCLRLLAAEHEVVAVLTRPDAPTGRGRKLTPSPVRAVAEELGLPVHTPRSLRGEEAEALVRSFAADAVAVVAYGLLVPENLLSVPTHGWINLHFSELPKWRGAAPVQRAVLAGEREIALTAFKIEVGMDDGDVIATEPAVLGEFETSGEALARLGVEGAPLLSRALHSLADGSATFTPQDHAAATRAAKLSVEEARVNFAAPYERVRAHILAFAPNPGAWAVLGGERIKLLSVADKPAPADVALAPGELLVTKKAVFVGTADQPLALGIVAAPGKKPLAAPDWARGARLGEAPRFEDETA